MKIKLVLATLVASLTFIYSSAQQVQSRVFEVLNLDYPGLEKVKKLHAKGDDKGASAALLEYYRERKNINVAGVDLSKITVSDADRKMADESLEHKFFAHRGYQPSYFYGKDIDWTYWPVKDNELRWQLHRHKWFTPLAKCYRTTGDEKYAAAYVEHYLDWLKKNPYPSGLKKRSTMGAAGDPEEEITGYDENSRFAWRPLEVSERINTQPEQFVYLLPSKSFTPEFLTVFLTAFNTHCDHIMNFYSDRGNHLLFEAQRLLCAGIYFPELKQSPVWRSSAIGVLNAEIGKQVYDDGMQYELDPHYHLAAINIFMSALSAADANGYDKEFPASYKNTIEKMIEIFWNISFSDYSTPMFSDNRRHEARIIVRNYNAWAKVYRDNAQIEYFATNGKKGSPPQYTSKAFTTSGYYCLRNGWDDTSTAMILKAGPPAFWHNQPDNGTFDLMIKGRNFFSDSGCYVYGGDSEIMAQRNWFRQTMIHKTLTLDNRNLERTDSKCLLFEERPDGDVVVVENPSYEGLTHRRSVFFVDKKYFVILDQGIGEATGKVAIHYQMGEDHVSTNLDAMSAHTTHDDGNNVTLAVFSPDKAKMEKEEGWISYFYREKFPREAFGIAVDKHNANPVSFVTVIMPVESVAKAPKVSAKIVNADSKGATVSVSVDGKERNFSYKL